MRLRSGTTTSATTSSPRRFAVVAAVVAGVILLVAIGMATLWFLKVYIPKSDYQAVASAYNTMVQTNSAIATLSANINGVATPDQIDQLTRHVSEVKTQAAAIGELRATRQDPTIQQAYRAFTGQFDDYLRAEQGVILLAKAGSDCHAANASAASKQACVAKLALVPAAGSAIMTTFAAQMTSAITSNDQLAYYDAQSRYNTDLAALQTRLETASNGLRDAINHKL